MLSATLQLCVRILPAKGIPTRGWEEIHLFRVFRPDDRIARKPERNRNFTRDRSRSFNLPETFFLSFFSLSFFMRITHRSRIDIFLEILRLICLHLLRVSRTFRKLCDSRFFGPERKSFDEVFDYSDYSRKKEIFLQFHARCISSE